ncbi:MAG: hypothetical protein ABIP89_02060 [Polyangiaceae bacterium]
MISQMALRVAEHIHGHMGWLSAAALLHPAILLRDPRRRVRLAAFLATSFVTTTGLIGAWIYPEYRGRLKQTIFIHAPKIGWLFERKEHLAVGALAFAWIGCIAHLACPTFADDALRRTVAVMAHRSYVIAFVLSVAVACLGVTVATYSTF